MEPNEPYEEYFISTPTSDIGGIRFVQRNWSRVAVICSGSDNSKLFMKQFVEADGHTNVNACIAEADSAISLSIALRSRTDRVRVIRPISVDPDLALITYPHESVEPVDDLIRRDEQKFLATLPRYLSLVRELFEIASSPEAMNIARARNTRESEISMAVPSLCFKGLEARNSSIETVDQSALTLFDLGPSYIGSREQAVARMVVSLVLINWGRPMMRFLRGPIPHVTALAIRELGSMTTVRVCENELLKQYEARLRNSRRSRTRSKLLQQLLLKTIGRRYIKIGLRQIAGVSDW